MDQAHVHCSTLLEGIGTIEETEAETGKGIEKEENQKETGGQTRKWMKSLQQVAENNQV